MDIYTEAQEYSLSTGLPYKLAALLFRNSKHIRTGVASMREHPQCSRINHYKQTTDTWMHAEMEALLVAQPGDTLEVIRWKADGSRSMAHPCPHCLSLARDKGITLIRYTDWDGNWKEFNPSLLTEEDINWWYEAYYSQRPRVPGWPKEDTTISWRTHE